MKWLLLASALAMIALAVLFLNGPGIAGWIQAAQVLQEASAR